MLSEGQLVGQIRILSRIGAGGMGVVWEGLDERLGRRVAVKTIRRKEADPAGARARSVREARILSRLEHPNICRLYEYLELGDSEVLVLELVRGRTLRKAIESGLLPAERLDVALGTCSALVAAHALSVVHRDLKPENVMLVEDGSVKVLDFGIARRVFLEDELASSGGPAVRGEAPASEASEAPTESNARPIDAPVASTADSLTATGQVPGTPRYMSPEQARGEPTTAASDMYSFGLLLRELYTGLAPYGAVHARDALVRAQLGEVPAPRGIDRQIAALVVDLTAQDPQRRPSAQQALERLRVVQRRPQRRLRATAAAVAVAGLVTGTVLSLYGLARARREAATATATSEFLERLFEATDPREAANPEVKARQILDRGADRLRSDLRGEPATRARLLTTLGGVYGNLGLNKEAQGLLEEAVALHETLGGPSDPALIQPLLRLANALGDLADHRRHDEAARRAARLAVQARRPLEEARAFNLLAVSLVRQERLDEAEVAARRAVELREASLGRDHAESAKARNQLAVIELRRGRYEAAESILAGVLAVLEQRLGPDHHDVAQVVNNLAIARQELGRLEEAEALHRRALAASERRLGPDHVECVNAHNNLAIVLAERADYAGAEKHYGRAVAIAEARLGARHPMTALFRANTAEAILLQGRASEALPLYEGALGTLRTTVGDKHHWVAETLRGLGLTHEALGHTKKAEELLLESATVREAAGGPQHPSLGKVLTQLGKLHCDHGDRARARPVLSRARTILEANFKSDHPALAELRRVEADAARAR